jgi:hypothetical protein
MKHKNHKSLVSDYENQKKKHLENLGTKLLKLDKINKKLKEKQINPNFLNLF